MISILGHSAIYLALLIATGGALAALTGRGEWARRWGRRTALIVALLVATAVALMEIALLGHDFSVRYVSEVGSRETPVYYTIVSLWGALEGSILLWVFVLSAYTVGFLLWVGDRLLPLQPRITGVLLAISAFFLFVIAGPGDPFGRISPVPTDGPGPPPLLQNHWMMGIHPVLLYCGYVGLAIPFAVTIAALLNGQSGGDVMRLVRRWALIPWVFLSLGIVAGMWWSYAVLGWGGYWSWDPVENASVMPWLITTAFLHSLQVQERRQMLKTWTMSLIIAAFLLSILGTFLTRSDVLDSVHSFTQSAVGPLFLGFFAVALIVSLILLVARSRDLAAPGVLESSLCRETAFLFNNLLLVAITFTILLGTLFPLLVEALQGTKLSVGAPYFNQVAVPIGFALLFLLGVGPALPWGAARLEDLQYRLLPAVASGVAIVVLLLAVGVRGVAPLVTFGASVFVLYITLARVLTDVRLRRGNTAESHAGAARRLLRANPRRYGGYLAHIGVLLVVVGIAASQSYGVRSTVTLHAGQSASVDGYTVTYLGWKPHPQSNRMVIQASMTARRGNENLGVLNPSQNYYPTLDTPVLSPAIREEPIGLLEDVFSGANPLPDLAQLAHGRNPFEDLYLVLAGVGTRPNGPVTVQILVNPLVGLIWLGGIVLGIGGMLALLPAARRRRAAAPVREAVALRTEEVGV